MRAFTAAVIPGFDPGTTDPARALLDHRYPFAKYAPFFASDLSRRAAQRFAGSSFASLDLAQRTAVIMEGLEGDATTRKLYRGAIFLTQVAIYAGIYDGDAVEIAGVATVTLLSTTAAIPPDGFQPSSGGRHTRAGARRSGPRRSP